MKYLKPELEVVLFDEDELVVTNLEAVSQPGSEGDIIGDDEDEWETQNL